MGSLSASALRFVGMARFTTAGAGAPTGVTKSNITVPALGTGVGDITLTLGQGGVDRTECVVFKAEEGTTYASTLVHTSDTAKQILIWDAAGAAADGSVCYGFFQFDRTQYDPGNIIRDMDLQLVGLVLLTTAGAGAPTVRENFNVTVPALGTGTGDISITLGEGGVDDSQCIVVKWDESATAQQSGVVHTSDTVKQLLIRTPNGDAAADGTIGVAFFRIDIQSYQ